MSKIHLYEKIGYGLGDMASSMFWKILSYYLPFFYSNIFGLRLDQVAILLIVTRIWDAISDPMMGVLADRTHTKWGKYRPYLLVMAIPFALSGIALFSAPNLSESMKLVWAYLTYIMMMTIYTGINVPYGAMLGVMTDDSNNKTVLSSFRMLFAYGGSFISLLLWEPLCKLLGGYNSASGWQNAMIVIAISSIMLFLFCFRLTKERLHTTNTLSIGKDLKTLLSNTPWWILIGSAICSNLFSTIRGSTISYYFNDVVGSNSTLQIGSGISFLFYAGLFLSIGEVCNMIGVAIASTIANFFGKKTTFILSFVTLIVMSIAFFYVPISQSGYWLMIVLQIVISIMTGIISPLVWSMYADVSDYAEDKYNTASTGLIFSSASMSQKFGSAFGGAAVMWLLALFGYNTNSGAIQTEEAINGLKIIMSWVPALVALIAVIITIFYPLNKATMQNIQSRLQIKRSAVNNQDTSIENTQIKLGFPTAMKWIFAILAVIIVIEFSIILIRL